MVVLLSLGELAPTWTEIAPDLATSRISTALVVESRTAQAIALLHSAQTHTVLDRLHLVAPIMETPTATHLVHEADLPFAMMISADARLDASVSLDR